MNLLFEKNDVLFVLVFVLILMHIRLSILFYVQYKYYIYESIIKKAKGQIGNQTQKAIENWLQTLSH